ncbi:MAG: YidC/Oxa1 family membrane protein insertase [Patescibacteria group bacterium]
MNPLANITINEKALITKILYQPLFNLLMLLYVYLPGQDLGVAIIALTLIIRIVLYPSYVKTLRSQQDMKKIQPEIDAIKKQYQGDQTKQSEETMRVYRENKINPLGGCLQLIIQLPFLYALYRVFMFGLTTDSLKLLYTWFPHAPVEINTMFLGFMHIKAWEVNLATPNIYMAVLAGIAQLLQSWLAAKFNPTPSNGGVAKLINMQMLYLFPIITLVVVMNLPAGVGLYWIASAVFMSLQQLMVTNQFKEVK